MNKDASVNKNLLLIAVVLTSFINPFISAAIDVALPNIAHDFSINAVTLSWVAMSFLLSSSVFLVPFGKLADIVGRKRIFQYGVGIITITAFLSGFALSATMLIVLRIIQGIGGAMMFGTGMALITSAFPPHERGRAIGINVSAVYIGLSIAPVLGGFLTQYLGWRSIFFVPVPVGIIVIIICTFFIKKEWAEAKNEKLDWKGSILYMLSVSSLMYGFSNLPDIHAIFLTLFGLLLTYVFIKVELKMTNPVMEVRLFKNNRIFAFSNLAAFINYAATFAIAFLLSLYLQYVKGLSPRQTGLVLLYQPVMMALVASFSGKLSDKHDPRILSSLGMAIIVIGLLLLSFISQDTSKIYIISSLLLLGVGFGMFSSPNTNSIMSSVEKRHLGVASATVGTMRLTGQMMSLGLATLIIHVFIGSEKISFANISVFLVCVKILFSIFSALCFLGVFASLARGKKHAV
jgi:EmrB/QacA subfamily drug resistance transporter